MHIHAAEDAALTSDAIRSARGAQGTGSCQNAARGRRRSLIDRGVQTAKQLSGAGAQLIGLGDQNPEAGVFDIEIIFERQSDRVL